MFLDQVRKRCIGMARGFVVLDENLYELKGFISINFILDNILSVPDLLVPKSISSPSLFPNIVALI